MRGEVVLDAAMRRNIDYLRRAETAEQQLADLRASITALTNLYDLVSDASPLVSAGNVAEALRTLLVRTTEATP